MIKMTGSLFVSGLHQDVTEKLLQANFHSFGPICSVQVCKTKITNSSCGYGFVTFKYCQDAEKALKCLNFRTLLGQPMHIMWAQHIHIEVRAKNIESLALHDTFLSTGEVVSCRVVCSSNEAQADPIQSKPWKARLTNAVKSVLCSPVTYIGIGIGILALGWMKGSNDDMIYCLTSSSPST
uniref:RRM domain-containing protein n=1 Tax=Cyprinus carpio carpio TaxID=630221 RepID=A0A9J8CE16_CYPCA